MVVSTLRSLALLILLICFSSPAIAGSTPDSFADLVAKLTPTVVNISTTQTVEVNANPFDDLFSKNGQENSPFKGMPEIFRHFYGGKGKGGPVERQNASLGSGFVIAPEGYIVTNHHVIDKADKITVIFSDDSKVDAKIIGKDAKTDIAILKVDVDRKLDFIKWGDSDKSRVGDWVIAIGNPFGLGGSVSAGIISARARDINAGPFDDFIQTDAAINRGNSGGPLFNTNGEVIGVNSAIFSPSGGNVGIGFAVPTSLALPVIKQLKETGQIKRGWLGVKIQTVTEEIAESIGLDKERGALVLEVTPDSPADKGGLLPGDIITTFDNKKVSEMRKLPRIVAETEIGKKVSVEVWRKEESKTLVVTIAKLEEDEENNVSNQEDNQTNERKNYGKLTTVLGLKLSNLNKKVRSDFDIANDIRGVAIISIDPDSLSAKKPIRKGDVIVAVNQESVLNIDDVEEFVSKAKSAKRKSVLLLVNRGGDTLFIAIPTGL